MPLVQRPHRGHQADLPARPRTTRKSLPQLGDGGDEFGSRTAHAGKCRCIFGCYSIPCTAASTSAKTGFAVVAAGVQHRPHSGRLGLLDNRLANAIQLFRRQMSFTSASAAANPTQQFLRRASPATRSVSAGRPPAANGRTVRETPAVARPATTLGRRPPTGQTRNRSPVHGSGGDDPVRKQPCPLVEEFQLGFPPCSAGLA